MPGSVGQDGSMSAQALAPAQKNSSVSTTIWKPGMRALAVPTKKTSAGKQPMRAAAARVRRSNARSQRRHLTTSRRTSGPPRRGVAMMLSGPSSASWAVSQIAHVARVTMETRPMVRRSLVRALEDSGRCLACLQTARQRSVAHSGGSAEDRTAPGGDTHWRHTTEKKPLGGKLAPLWYEQLGLAQASA